ncbi:MAG: ABC transporter substrate-binding protein [Candidatus Methylomirabilales bacterium]
MKRMLGCCLLGFALVVAASSAAWAEAKELRVAKQYGLGYLQQMLMEDQKLVEKHARAAGLGEVKVTWSTFRSSDVMNDALLSGNIEFASVGAPGLGVIWSRTRGTPQEVKAAFAYNYFPTALNTRDPNIKTLADHTEKHKIAVPAVKVSNQAIFLQMAAAKLYGMANYTKFDALTVSMTHPDGMAAMLSGHGEITSHFTAVPFVQKELEKPGIRKIVSADEILGAPNCHNFMIATKKFYTENPKLYAAFLSAMREATDIINKDKRAAAELYIRVTKDKSSPDDILKIMNDKGNAYAFDIRPEGDMKTLQFMHQIGSIKVRAESWDDLLFPSPRK